MIEGYPQIMMDEDLLRMAGIQIPQRMPVNIPQQSYDYPQMKMDQALLAMANQNTITPPPQRLAPYPLPPQPNQLPPSPYMQPPPQVPGFGRMQPPLQIPGYTPAPQAPTMITEPTSQVPWDTRGVMADTPTAKGGEITSVPIESIKSRVTFDRDQVDMFKEIMTKGSHPYAGKMTKEDVLKPISIDASDGTLLDGHHRLQALKELGYKDIKVIYRGESAKGGEIKRITDIPMDGPKFKYEDKMDNEMSVNERIAFRETQEYKTSYAEHLKTLEEYANTRFIGAVIEDSTGNQYEVIENPISKWGGGQYTIKNIKTGEKWKADIGTLKNDYTLVSSPKLPPKESAKGGEIEYIYHGTAGKGRLSNIQRDGLKTGQAIGATKDTPVYHANTEKYAKTYADRKGADGYILRIKKSADAIHDESTGLKGDYKTGNIPPENIEIKAKDGKYVPLKDYDFLTDTYKLSPKEGK